MSSTRPRSSVDSPPVQKVPWFWFIGLSSTLILSQFREIANPTRFEGSSADLLVEAVEATGNPGKRMAYFILGVGGILALLRSNRQKVVWNPPITIVLLLIAAWSTLSYFWSDDPGVTLRRLIVFYLFMIGAVAVVVRWDLLTILLFVAMSGCLNLTVGFFSEIASGTFMPMDPYYRFAGTMTHPNQQGQACAVLVLTAYIASRALKGWMLVFYRSVAFFGLVFLGLTKSRTSMAALVAGMAVYWFLTSEKKRKWRRIYFVVMAALVAALLIGELVMEKLPETVALGRATEDVMTFTGRIPLWGVCLDYAGQRPLLGYGFESFWTPKHIDSVSYDVGWGVPSAHSAVVELLLTLGIIGLILHILFLVLIWRYSKRMLRRTESFEYAIAAAMIALFIVLGTLESTLIIAASITNFYVVITLLGVAFGAPVSHGLRRARFKPSPNVAPVL